VVQSDHEGANACALAANTVASALADPFLALSAGLNALAGPVHGLASEMSLRFVLELIARHGDDIREETILDECRAQLDRGQVIPGFGHAVLRAADPRFTAVHRFAMEALGGDPVLRVCDVMSRQVPPLLTGRGRAKNPWPNIDFISGPVLHHYGVRDARFLTVIFGVSLALGVLAQYVVNCALHRPLLRPRSISLAGLKRLCEQGGAA
jgi:citrate synthase